MPRYWSDGKGGGGLVEYEYEAFREKTRIRRQIRRIVSTAVQGAAVAATLWFLLVLAFSF